MTEEDRITQMLNNYFAALEARDSAQIAAHWHPEGLFFSNGEPRPRAALTDTPPTATLHVQDIRRSAAPPPLAQAEVNWTLREQNVLTRYQSFFVLVQDAQGQWRITHQTNQETETPTASSPAPPSSGEPVSSMSLQAAITEKPQPSPSTPQTKDKSLAIKRLHSAIERSVPPEFSKVEVYVTPKSLKISWPEEVPTATTLLLLFIVPAVIAVVFEIFWVIPLLIVIFILCLPYISQAKSHKTTISVTTNYLTIGNDSSSSDARYKIATPNIKQIYVNVIDELYTETETTYQVMILTRQGAYERLMGFDSEPRARFIKEAIEKYLSVQAELAHSE